MKGIEGDVGFLIAKTKNFGLDSLVGSYYFEGFGKRAIGGKVRVTANITDYLTVGGQASYDNLFHERFEGLFSLNVPFGPKSPKEKGCAAKSCNNPELINHKLVQGVDRNEIIVLDNKRIIKELPVEIITSGSGGSITELIVAINPNTGMPWVFWFVNNTSTSNGTFESPYPTLALAQTNSSPNDAIYVYAGDGTGMGMSAGIVLKSNQKFWGAGNDQLLPTTVGTVTIPAQGVGKPQVTNATNVVTCADANEIAGIHLISQNQTSAILCTSVTDGSIHDNVIDLIGVDMLNSTFGLFFDMAGGQFTVENNTFNVDPTNLTTAVEFMSTVPGGIYNFESNQFIGPALGSPCLGFEFGSNNTTIPLGDFDTISLVSNQFVNIGNQAVISSEPINGEVGFNGTGRLILDQNTFDFPDGDFAAVAISVGGSGNLNIRTTNNTWTNTQNNVTSFDALNFDSASSCVTLKDNSSDVPTGAFPAYSLENFGSGTMTVDISGNIGDVVSSNPTGVCPP